MSKLVPHRNVFKLAETITQQNVTERSETVTVDSSAPDYSIYHPSVRWSQIWSGGMVRMFGW